MIHYGAKNVNTPAQMTLMGYSEETEWTLKTADVPAWTAGDKLTFAVQSYYHRGAGANDIEKAQYLNSSSFGSSVWSQLVTLTHP